MPFNVAEFHLDTYATNYVLGYAMANPRDTLAERVFTTIPTPVATGKFKRLDKGSWYRTNVEERALGGENKLAYYDTTDGVFLTREYGLKHRIDDRVMANNNSPLDLSRTAAMYLMGQHQIHKDGYLASKFFTTGVWGTDIVGVSSGPTGTQILQFDQSGSKPIQVIRKYRRAIHKSTGRRPNVLALGADVYDTLLDHADIVGRLSDNSDRIVNEQKLASIFEVDDVVVADPVYNAAAEGLTTSMQYIVNSKVMWLGHRAPLATTDGTAVTAGAIYPWTGLIPGTNGDGMAILRRRYEAAYSWEWDSRYAWDMQTMAPDLAVFFSSVVA